MGFGRIGFGAVVLVLTVGGCAKLPFSVEPAPAAELPSPADPAARTVEAFDTTSKAERAAAATAVTGGVRLGSTLASLGDPTDPGFWLKTPLVRAQAQGYVVTPSGKSVHLTLLPLDAAPGAGSRISLPAMRVLEVALTDLPELIVCRD